MASGRRRSGRPVPGEPPAISRHLRVLREAGLSGRGLTGRRLYALDPRPLRELDDWLAPYRDLWAQRLDALDTEIARGRRAPTTKPPMTEDLETRRGVVTTEDDGRQRLEFHRSWPDPIEDVWSALTEPDRLARWIGVYQGERAGRRHPHLLDDAGGGRARRPGRRRSSMRSAAAAGGRMGAAGRRRLARRSRPVGGGRADRAALRLLFPAAADVADMAMGWHWYLDKLDGEIWAGRSPPTGTPSSPTSAPPTAARPT